MAQPRNNGLLAAFETGDLNRLLLRLERIQLPQGKVLFRLGDCVRHVYFPCSGVVSLLGTSDDDEALEVASVGPEGIIGLPSVICDAPASHEAVVQIAGEGFRYPLVLLVSEFRRSPAIQKVLLQYTSELIAQMCAAVLCHRFHTVEQRVCRTLLRARLAVRSDRIELTQEALARVLAVQRTAISSAATALQDDNLIRFRRGRIHLVNRSGLEARACDCYRLDLRAARADVSFRPVTSDGADRDSLQP